MKKKTVICLIVLTLALISLSACNEDVTDVKSYLLTYDSGQGSAVEPVFARLVVDMPIPTLGGHIFEGWYESSDFTGNQVSFPYTLSGNTILYARWFTAEQGSPYLSYVLTDNGYQVNAYSGFSYIAVIPEKHLDIPVVSISNSAFTVSDSVEMVAIPQSVTEIGSSFYRSANLKSIQVDERNNSFKSIDGVLYNKDVTSLVSYPPARRNKIFTMPSSVTVAEEFALRFASYLEKLVIPKNLNEFKNNFEGCYSLKEIDVSEENTSFKSIGGVLFSKDGAELLFYPSAKNGTTYNIPLGTQSVAKGTFDNSMVEELTLSASMSKFPIVSSDSLKKIKLEADNQTFSSVDGVLFNKDATVLLQYPSGREGEKFDYLLDGKKIEAFKYTVPDGVLTVAEKAFSDAVRLNKVVFPASVEVLERYAFDSLNDTFNLYAVEFASASRLQSLGDYAFHVKTLREITLSVIEPPKKGESIFAAAPKEINVPQETVAIYADWAGRAVAGKDISQKYTLTLHNAESHSGSLITAYVTELTSPQKDGYSFVGWFDSENKAEGNKVPFPLALYGDTDLYAYWAESSTGTNGLSYKKFETESGSFMRVTGYDGTEKSIHIPSTHEDIPVTEIADYAFNGKDFIEEVHLPESMEKIGKYAFAGKNAESYMRLKKINIENTLINTIELHAFQYCVFLEDVKFPSTLKSIASSAFSHCFNLSAISFPEGFAELGDQVFTNCKSLEAFEVQSGNENFTAIDGVLYAVGLDSMLHLIKFPEGLRLESFSPPSNVTGLQQYSFYRASIGKITLNSHVKNINTNVFTYMDVQTLVLGEGIVEFNFELFKFSTLETIQLPQSFKNVSPKMEKMDNFKGFVVNSENSHLKSEGGALYSKDGKVLHRVPVTFFAIDLLSGLEEIGEYAFAYGRVKNINLPSSVKRIGSFAFYGCANLTSLSIPSKTEYVGTSAFLECSALQHLQFTSLPEFGVSVIRKNLTVRVPENMEEEFKQALPAAVIISSYNIQGMQLELVDNEYYRLIKVTDAADIFTIPSAVNGKEIRAIAKDAFNGAIRKVVIPKEIKKVEGKAFSSEGLVTVVFEEGSLLEELSVSAFSGAQSLINLVLPVLPESPQNASLFNLTSKELRIFAGTSCFDHLSSLHENVYPMSVVLGDYAIYQGVYIGYLGTEEEIELPQVQGAAIIGKYFLPSFVRKVVLSEGITELEDYAFGGIESHSAEMTLNTVLFNSGLEKLGSKVFYGTDIKALHLPASTESIRSDSFENTPFLQEISASGAYYSSANGVLYSGDGSTLLCYPTGKSDWTFTLPGSVLHIGEKAFYGAKLLSVKFNSNLQSIGAYAFAECGSLMNVTLPSGILTVGEYAFSSNGILELNLPQSLIEFSSTAVFNCLTLENIYSSSDSFISEDGILYSGDKRILISYPAGRTADFTLPEAVNEIAPYAFFATKLTKLNLTNVKIIGEGAFAESFIKEITLDANITKIAEKTFMNASRLEKVILQSGENALGITSIGGYAFYGCASLRQLDMPESIESIGEYAFSHSGLTQLVLGGKVSFIGDFALSECKSLTSLELSVALTNAGQTILYSTDSLHTIKMNMQYNFLQLFGTFQPKHLTTLKIHEQPYEINHTVTESFFEGSIYLLKVELPSSLKAVQKNAFKGCTNLSEVVFAGAFGEQRLDFVGDYAFGNCPSLKKFESRSSRLEDNISAKAFWVDEAGGTTIPTALKVYVEASLLSDYLEKEWAQGLVLAAAA